MEKLTLQPNNFSFKNWFLTEDEIRGQNDKKSANKGNPENYLDGMWRELGIDPNSIPEFIESGPIEIADEGIWFNQAIWQVVKPIDLKDAFVRIKFHKSTSPNLNQHAYIRRENGQMVPYTGDLSQRIHMIPIKKFAEMLGKGWQSAAQGGDMGMGGMGGGGMF